jgi:hypothetical protein
VSSESPGKPKRSGSVRSTIPRRIGAWSTCRVTIRWAPDCVAPSTDDSGRAEVDEVLLARRAAFLRPDSLVAIVMLTDENDCSMVPGGLTGWSRP